MNKRNLICKILMTATFLYALSNENASGKNVSKSNRPANTLRVLYWNIQNGMWSDQGNNYNNFVEWIKSYSPDVCIWCEAQTIYKTGTADPCTTEERYLTDNWKELAARYGHKYWAISGHRDNYPQVITSKYPINKILDITGEEPDSIVTHGAGHYRIKFRNKKINFVSLHTWPQAHAYRAKDQALSRKENGGDKYRRMEIEYICSHTINASTNADKEFWLMCGDFNSRSSKDNDIYKFAPNDTRLLVHDYILQNTPYLDVIKEKYPDQFISSTGGQARIDFIYCTQPLNDRVVRAEILKDAYTGNIVRDPKKLSNFYHPSDHRPILVDFDMGKKQ